MDSSDEVISDNILSYLLDSATARDSVESSFIIEGENETNVSTATDNDGLASNVSELDTSHNPLTSPSLKSGFSAKKLEWDSSADVGSIPTDKLKDFQAKLSTLERMALSNSASKLCLDEDGQSIALLAKIDRVLARSKHHLIRSSTTGKVSNKKINKLPTWPSLDSGSNASADTVIPQESHKQVPCSSKQDRGINTDELRPPAESPAGEEAKAASQTKKQGSLSSSKGTSRQSSKSSVGSEISSQLFVTRSMVGEVDLYASNRDRQQPESTPVTPINFMPEEGANHEHSSGQCHCVSPAEYSETNSCPTHTSVSSTSIRRLQKEALEGELQVYRGLKDHLKSLKEYVSQLEQTWKFLDQTKAAAKQNRKLYEDRRSRRSHHESPSARVQPAASSFPELPSPSASTTCSHLSLDDHSTPIHTGKTSERSFELERLNLHDTDSTNPTPKPSRKLIKAKCCTHCSLKTQESDGRKGRRSSQKKANAEVQTSVQQVVPQREPIAYEIPVNNGKSPKRPKSKTSLQEALKEKRPDFVEDSERRRHAIQEITQLRRVGKVDCNAIPRLFTYQELRKHTEQIYRQLPEANPYKKDQKRKEAVISNRIKASMFQKKLQERVLHGQLNLPHSTCL